MTGTKVEAIHHHGVPSAENFVVGRVLQVEQHPDADRLKVCKVDLGTSEAVMRRTGRTIVCGAPNVAAGQTVAVARPGAVMPDGTKLKQAKLRGVVSEGMILAENELEIGVRRRDPGSTISCSTICKARRGARPRNTAGGRAADRAARCSSSRSPPTGRTASACTAWRASCTPLRERRSATQPWSEDPGSRDGPSDGEPPRCRRGDRRVSGPLPALHRARVRGRHDRALAAVAEGAADGGRAAADQQRGRHHQLRDAAHRPAAARVRPRPRRRRSA